MSFGLNSTATLSYHGLDGSGYGFTFQPVVCQTGHPIGDQKAHAARTGRDGEVPVLQLRRLVVAGIKDFGTPCS
jgi:hypothetical protein